MALIFVALLTGCGTASKTASKRDPVISQDTQDKLDKLVAEAETINNSVPGALALRYRSVTATDNACIFYEKMRKLQEVSVGVAKLGNHQQIGEAYGKINEWVNLHGEKFTKAAYNQLKAGYVPECGEGEGSYAVEEIGVIIDEYGDDDASVDPMVIRAAFIKAMKAESAKLHADFRVRPGRDVSSAVEEHIKRAEKWQLSATEIGIPQDIVKKIQ